MSSGATHFPQGPGPQQLFPLVAQHVAQALIHVDDDMIDVDQDPFEGRRGQHLPALLGPGLVLTKFLQQGAGTAAGLVGIVPTQRVGEAGLYQSVRDGATPDILSPNTLVEYRPGSWPSPLLYRTDAAA